jgi:NitT/TauT family transport system substrate-binding protein
MPHFLSGWHRQPPLCNIFPYAAVIFLLTLLAACDSAQNAPLRLGTHAWPGYETLHLAESLGYFEPSAIRIVQFANASQTALALRNGTADAAALTLDEALTLMQDGADLRVILVMDISNGADVVMARPEILKLQGIRGRKVAVENGAVGAVMLDATLEAAGLKIEDIRLVSATMNEHVNVYRTGKADVVVTFEPVRSELVKQGARLLFDSSAIPGRIMDVLVVRANVINEHREGLKKLVAAHFKALAYLSRQPQDAATRIAPFLGVQAAEVLPQYEGLILPDLAENHTLLSGKTPRLKTQAANLAELLYKRKLLQRVVSVDHLVEPMFLPQK